MDQPTRVQPIPVAASMALGALAGYVDAIAFGRLFGVFPANQSGNAILLGMALGDPSSGTIWRPATAIAGFVAGIVGAVVLRREWGSRRPTLVLVLVEAVILASVAVAIGDLTTIPALLDGPRGASLLFVTAVAMGVQTEVIRAHAGVSLSTTYQSGVLVQIAERVAPGGGPPGEPRRPPGAVVLLGGVLTGYIGGAALGAAMGRTFGWALAVPVALLALLALTEPWWGRSRAR